jgi:bacillithiol biosynthesis cysteine-adding enzyme BshC
MIKSTIDPDCTGQFSPLFLDYIHQKDNLRPFYHFFPSLPNFKNLVEGRSFDKPRRATLSQTLQSQYQGFELTDATSNNIELLKETTTFTVTTGHQLNLFTGPLYFIYKIVSTINLAEKLKQAYPAYHFVPVYWMASEDHDFAEIDHFYLDGKDYSWKTDQTGAVGEFLLDKSIKELLKEAAFAPDFFKKAYLEQETLAGAVRYYVNYLFGDKGLVVIDGNSPDLKSLFAPVIKDDLLHHSAKALVDSTTDKLEQLGYKSQIFPREINFFYLDKGIRERIEKVGDEYKVLNTNLSFTPAEVEELIDKNPEKFSPNVVLRPLYQECILPNIAYLGGPAEVAYWLQLKPMFDHYQIDFPAVMPRNFVMVLDAFTQRKMNALELHNREIFADYTKWKKEYTIAHAGQDITLNSEKEKLERIFFEVERKARATDPTLVPSALAAHKRSIKIIEQFSEKLRKAEERTLATALTQMQDLKNALFPNGNPQERKNNFLMFYLEDPKFIEKLYAHLDPLDFDFIILRQQ